MILQDKSQEHLIRDYLLGQLPEIDQDLVQERLIADPEFFETSLIIEGELFDDYVSGTLSENERTKIEDGFLANPEQYQRVQFFKMLGRIVLHNDLGETEKQRSNQERLLSEAHKNRRLAFSLFSNEWLGFQILGRLQELSSAVPDLLAEEFGFRNDLVLETLHLLFQSGLIEQDSERVRCSRLGKEMIDKLEGLCASSIS